MPGDTEKLIARVIGIAFPFCGLIAWMKGRGWFVVWAVFACLMTSVELSYFLVKSDASAHVQAVTVDTSDSLLAEYKAKSDAAQTTIDKNQAEYNKIQARDTKAQFGAWINDAKAEKKAYDAKYDARYNELFEAAKKAHEGTESKAFFLAIYDAATSPQPDRRIAFWFFAVLFGLTQGFTVALFNVAGKETAKKKTEDSGKPTKVGEKPVAHAQPIEELPTELSLSPLETAYRQTAENEDGSILHPMIVADKLKIPTDDAMALSARLFPNHTASKAGRLYRGEEQLR